MILIPLLLSVPGPAPDSLPPSLASKYVVDALPLQDEELPHGVWKGAITVGASLTDGNTDIKRASAAADGVKRVGDDRYTLGAAWNYAEENGSITQRRAGGRAQWDHFVSEKSYILGQVSAETDAQAAVDLRYTAGVGYGYQFRDDEEWRLSGEAGLTYFNQKFTIPDAMGETEFDYIAARGAYRAEWDYSERWAFMQIGEIFPSLEDSEDVYSKLDTRAKATLTESMFAQLQWVFDWNNSPAPGLERSDNLYLLTVGWNF